MAKVCPVCKSPDTEIKEVDGFEFLTCKKCGYDEADEYDIYPEERSAQKGKSGYTPYKRGGAQRSAKR